MNNKVDVKILDTTYTIISDETVEYVEFLARTVDKKIRDVLNANNRASTSMGAVLTAFNLCDELNKSTEAVDNLRAQIKTYFAEINKLRTECDELRRELAKR